MRPRHHASGPAWSVNLGEPAPPLPAPAPEPELPLGQRIVLLKLRRGELAAAIREKLAAMSVPEPLKSDWSAMIEANYVGRTFVKGGVGKLALTPSAHAKVHEIMRGAAVAYGVHLMQRSGNVRGKYGITTRCSCGAFSRTHFSFNGHLGAIIDAEVRHLRAVEAGTWQLREATDRLTNFLNEVSPPRFNFNSGGGPDPGVTARSVIVVAPGDSAEAKTC